MNRSILIVICDFIVTSMIYLNFGMGTPRFYYGAEAPSAERSSFDAAIREVELRETEIERQRTELLKDRAMLELAASDRTRLTELNAELAEARTRIDVLTRQSRLNPENAGTVSAAELQKELDAETVTRNRLLVEYETVQKEILRYRETTAQAKKAQEALEKLQNSTERDLSAARNTLETTRTELGAARENLGTARAELARTSERLAARERELGTAQTELGTAQTRIGDYREQLAQRDRQIAFMQGRAAAMEKELAGSRDRLEQSRRENQQREAELASVKTQLETLQKVLKKAATDLSGTRTELKQSASREQQAREELAAAEGNLKAASAKLNAAEEKLRSDVLKRYSAAAVRLRRHLQEKRLLGNRNVDDTYFLPAIAIGGKTCVISALKTLGGMREHSSNYDDVSELEFRIARPDGKEGDSALAGPLLVLKTDCRVALMEIPSTLNPALPVLTRDELKRRGIQDLYLFKASSFGKDSTILNERCSMSFDRSDDYLYVRNGARVSSELKAEVGDLVLTKQGELVAVVVAQEEFDMGRQIKAHCFVFDHLPGPEEFAAIPLDRPAQERYFSPFAERFNYWLKQAELLDAGRRN